MIHNGIWIFFNWENEKELHLFKKNVKFGWIKCDHGFVFQTHTQNVNSAGILELLTSCNIAEFVFKKRITATFKKYLLNKPSF